MEVVSTVVVGDSGRIDVVVVFMVVVKIEEDVVLIVEVVEVV